MLRFSFHTPVPLAFLITAFVLRVTCRPCSLPASLAPVHVPRAIFQDLDDAEALDGNEWQWARIGQSAECVGCTVGGQMNVGVGGGFDGFHYFAFLWQLHRHGVLFPEMAAHSRG